MTRKDDEKDKAEHPAPASPGEAETQDANQPLENDPPTPPVDPPAEPGGGATTQGPL